MQESTPFQLPDRFLAVQADTISQYQQPVPGQGLTVHRNNGAGAPNNMFHIERLELPLKILPDIHQNRPFGDQFHRFSGGEMYYPVDQDSLASQAWQHFSRFHRNYTINIRTWEKTKGLFL
jgi:hypothetical protein